MGKTYVNTIKYIIQEDFEIKGVVDKPDIIGAIFGQSEGLLGDDLDLRELQKNGRIGRIEINLNSAMGASKGEIIIPSSMDMVETSILAAAIESVDKVGPCEAKFATKNIEDTRSIKRKEITDRAKELLKRLMQTQIPDSQELAEEVKDAVKVSEVQEFGPEKLACGPGIREDDSIIIVEGRADVLNLLKNNIRNVICMGGSQIPKTIIDLANKKTVTLFIDGDRGGELNLRKLSQLAEVEFVARAPDGKEVEELTRKEIIMSLRKKTPVVQATSQAISSQPLNNSIASTIRSELKQETLQPEPSLKPLIEEATSIELNFPQKPSNSFQRTDSRPSFNRGFNQRPDMRKRFERPTRFPFNNEQSFKPMELVRETITEEEKTRFEPLIKELKGTLKARLLDEQNNLIEEVPVRDLLKSLNNQSNVNAVIFDGIITRRVVEEAKKNKIKYVVAVKKGKLPEEKEVKALTINA